MPKVTYLLITIRDKYISQTIDSVKSQTFEDWELIVFNGDPNRVLEFNHPKIKVINKQQTLVDSIEQGREMARSSVIMFINDDDVDLPNRAQVIYDGIQAGADVFLASYDVVDENLNFIRSREIRPFKYEKYVKGANMPLMTGGFRNDTCPPFRKDLMFLADIGFFIDCHLKGLKIVTSKDKVAKIRRIPDNLCQPDLVKDNIRRTEAYRLQMIFNNPEIWKGR